MRRVSSRAVVVGLLLIQAALLAWQAWRYSPTVDEVAHLPAGLSHWQFGRFDLYRVNPPLVRMLAAAPLLVCEPKTDWSNFTEQPYARPEFSIGSSFANANGVDTFWLFTLARWACIPLILLGGWSCYRWARDLSGEAAGLVSLALWCFCPNVLGNGTLITPDAPAAALGVTAGYAFWRWLRQPGWKAAFVAGLTLGLAELTKSTWIILFGLWPLLAIVWCVAKWFSGRSRSTDPIERVLPSPPAGEGLGVRGQASRDSTLTTDPSPINGEGRAGFDEMGRPQEQASSRLVEKARPSGILALQLAVILLLALYLLNLGFGFENSFKELGQFQFISRSLGGPEAHEKPGNRFAGTWLGSLPVPVPANYLIGIDVQRYDFEKKKWSYLRGEQKEGGWWYYYLYAIGVKTPAGTLFLVALAGLFWLVGGRAFRGSWLDSLVVLAPGIVVLALVSSQTGFSRYLRYVVPAFPFVFVWTASVVGKLLSSGTRGLTPPARQAGSSSPPAAILHSPPSLLAPRHVLVLLPLTASIASCLGTFPHTLSYFNEVAGGPLNGAAHLLDANIDWGQDLLFLKDWYDTHPDDRPLYLSYFGFIDAKLVGMQFELASGIRQLRGTGTPAEQSAGAPPGWYVVSVNDLHGYKHFGNDREEFAWLRNSRPVSRAGYSILIFHAGERAHD